MKGLTITMLLVLLSANCPRFGGRAASVADSTGAAAASATAPTGTASGWSAIEQKLRAAGVSMTAVGAIEQPFWTKSARVFSTPDGDLQVYEFASSADAEAGALQVGAGGGTIRTSSIAWMAPPHFFRSDNVIVIYLGSSTDLLEKLETVLGKPFAGR